MQTAAVGFQCPECVKEGNKSVRRPTAPYGGQPSPDGRVTMTLIGINVMVWLAITATGGGSSTIVDKLALLPRGAVDRHQGELVLIKGVSDGAWWQVITSEFVHVSPLHIATNMMALYFLGRPVEMILGKARFLGLYLVAGLCGSAAVMLFSPTNAQTLGASGAIFGLFGALLVIGHKAGADLRQLVFWIGLNVILTFTLANISWQGHLGGFAGGAVAAAVLVYSPRERRTTYQIAGLVLLALIALAVIVVRAHSLGSFSLR